MERTLNAVGSPRRQRILQLVWERERSAGEIHRALGDVTFGAVSQQLGVLRRAGVVHQRRDGRHRYYRANREALGPMCAYLEAMWSRKLEQLKALAEADEGDTP